MRRSCAWLLLLLPAWGCESEGTQSGDAGMQGAGELNCDVQAIFAADGLSGLGCTGAICHGGGGVSPDFQAPGLAMRLLDQPAAVDGPCDGELLIDSEHPEQSLLLTKLGNSPPCGSPMPLTNRDSLTESALACIEEYVQLAVAGEIPD